MQNCGHKILRVQKDKQLIIHIELKHGSGINNLSEPNADLMALH